MDVESLYSLELVVDKLYIPHTVCRFPAVAFRLLDFPTILIEHVESDLASKIKYKISRDPYYEVPEQFQDLKDKEGNFLVKKGKSCLFKISTKSLKSHLSNTPLYVMILDSFEKVPKLLGNSTIPLDEVMGEITEDIKSMGHTVPSVHGDKGLFKIFSLMGKEIGYIVMGFRLLSLGPGLIPHIPDSAIAKRASEHKVISVKPTEEHVFRKPMSDMPVQREKELISTQEMGSMTEPEKQDALMQTIDMCDKQIHVALSVPENEKEKADREKISYTISTQTDRKKRRRVNIDDNKLDVEIASDNEDLFLPNMVQPPPLFYNSENEPRVKIERAFNYDDDQSSIFTEDLHLEDISDDEENKVKKKIESIRYERNKKQAAPQVVSKHESVNVASYIQSIGGENIPSDGPLFPILTALLNELTKLQNPTLIQQTMHQVQQVKSLQAKYQQQQQPSIPPKEGKLSRPTELGRVKTFVQQNASKLQQKDRKGPTGDEGVTSVDATVNRPRTQKSRPPCAQPPESVPKTKGWIRKAPELGVKKSKLSYGLTNTQRLRLAKVNPEWLKTMEKEELDPYRPSFLLRISREFPVNIWRITPFARTIRNIFTASRECIVNKLNLFAETWEAKSAIQKPPPRLKEEEEFPTGEVSDTLTEVRRLALKNLNATDEDTLKDLELSSIKPKHGTPRRGRRKSPRRKRSKSPKTKKTDNKQSALDKVDKEAYSPQADDEGSEDENPSYPSQRSIEVRIPSAQVYQEESDVTMNESGSDNKKKAAARFPGFADHNTSLPESIDGDMNKSLNDHYDDDSPMESTRNEKSERKMLGERRTQSTLDYDSGTHQFQSTEEPELQKLMDSGERSEISDVMSSGHTDKTNSPVPVSNSQMISARFQVLNPKASLQSPIPAIRRSQVKIDSPGRTSPASKSPVITPRRSRTPSPSSKVTLPHLRKSAREKRFDFKHESIHTESVSSYMPSDGDEDEYSDDFQDDGVSPISSPDIKRKVIPATKLGYTIH